MIRIIKQKNTDIRCLIIQMVLLIAMMLSFAFLHSGERIFEPASPNAGYDGNQDISSEYISTDYGF